MVAASIMFEIISLISFNLKNWLYLTLFLQSWE
jgi:hypothetical protein